MDAIKYFEERERMFKNLGAHSGTCADMDCRECPLIILVNGETQGCFLNEKESVAIVEKWSEENPRKTIRQDFLEKFPNADTEAIEHIVQEMCPIELGYKVEEITCRVPEACERCWDSPLED